MEGVEKVTKSLAKTNDFLRSLLTTLQVWPRSRAFLHTKRPILLKGDGQPDGQTYTLIASEV